MSSVRAKKVAAAKVIKTVQCTISYHDFLFALRVLPLPVAQVGGQKLYPTFC
jgi:hypothetical protein